MQRVRIDPRPDWREKVEALGLTWHTSDDGKPYWDESAYWRFDSAEIDRIEEATNQLYDMCLEAVGHVIDTGQLDAFGYDEVSAGLIEQSWRDRSWEPTVYARFDLAYDGHDLKLLELNGDTPTSLVEAAVIQWWWLQDRFDGLDQFNSIHEKLVAAFGTYAEAAATGQGQPPLSQVLHFTAVTPHEEDEGTVTYMAACAAEAGLSPIFVPLGDIGWQEEPGRFVDGQDRPIQSLFKLVPWEWLLADPFGADLAGQVSARQLRLIEPAWKMLASHKRLLVTLKQLYPDSELLLDATVSREKARAFGEAVKKPVLGREGQNVSILKAADVGFEEEAKLGGTYGDDDFIYQARANLAQADGNWAVLGSWVVNREACGMGVRESDSPITGNTARFVPHILD
jgi:glutathionylspermidine synthase